jgi:hypothetical protein
VEALAQMAGWKCPPVSVRWITVMRLPALMLLSVLTQLLVSMRLLVLVWLPIPAQAKGVLERPRRWRPVHSPEARR